jgi:hypothetical protein
MIGSLFLSMTVLYLFYVLGLFGPKSMMCWPLFEIVIEGNYLPHLMEAYLIFISKHASNLVTYIFFLCPDISLLLLLVNFALLGISSHGVVATSPSYCYFDVSLCPKLELNLFLAIIDC